MSAAACKPNMLRASIWHLKYVAIDPGSSDGNNSLISLLPLYVMFTTRLDMADILKANGWKFPDEVIIMSATTNWGDFVETLDLIVPKDFAEVLCKAPDKKDYHAIIKYFFDQGYRFDPKQVTEVMADAQEDSKEKRAYLMTLLTDQTPVNERLLIAVFKKDTATVRAILENEEADVNYEADDAVLLQYAIRNEDLFTLRLLFGAGTNANWMSKDSLSSVLLEAVLQGSKPVFDALNPYLRSVNMSHRGNINVLHHLANYTL
jgi:hypothetical protein